MTESGNYSGVMLICLTRLVTRCLESTCRFECYKVVRQELYGWNIEESLKLWYNGMYFSFLFFFSLSMKEFRMWWDFLVLSNSQSCYKGTRTCQEIEKGVIIYSASPFFSGSTWWFLYDIFADSSAEKKNSLMFSFLGRSLANAFFII